MWHIFYLAKGFLGKVYAFDAYVEKIFKKGAKC